MDRASGTREMAGPSGLRIGVALLLVYVLWGSTYLAIRFAVESIPPFAMAATRFLTAGALLYGWVRLRGGAGPTRAQWVSASVIGGLMLLGANGAVVWAEQSIPSALAALLVSTVPLFMALIEWVRHGKRPTAPVGAGLLLGFAGVVLLVGPAGVAGSMLVPALVTVAGAFAWAIGTLYGRTAAAPSSALMGSAMQMLAGGSMLLVLSLVSGESTDWAQVSTQSLLSLGYLVVFGSLVGFTAYSWLMRNVNPTLSSTYAYVNPVVAVFLGWAFAGEAITARTVVASALVVGSVGLITVARNRKAPVAQRLPDEKSVEPLPVAESRAGQKGRGLPPEWASIPLTDVPSGEMPAFNPDSRC